MKSIHKNVWMVVCGVALSVGASTTIGLAEHSPSSGDVMKMDSLTEGQKYNFQSDDDKQQNVNDGKSHASGAKTIKGELFRIDDAEYFVKTKGGAEVRLHTDKTTNMRGKIRKGDQIEATVNDQNHALSIQAIR
ncbi:MAG TPA: hypothetical protein VN666_04000 [Nitrospira sp.]|nr:hypothetical protein [Nitrospira sp.]